jgi:hypothetical protein
MARAASSPDRKRAPRFELFGGLRTPTATTALRVRNLSKRADRLAVSGFSM